jgi:hypothetical protein
VISKSNDVVQVPDEVEYCYEEEDVVDIHGVAAPDASAPATGGQ